ncbi:hypothetical protein [Actinokineospora sp. NBRC 105648]|uniref:hypothetical protein n=1 Tax=Actinokineospora sp. NBRC 105648 TaxID=3032206 RepID=UPI0024A01BB3|nr:hypothetical protein [Actinokineospora sp. NBRC 105648]GLZ40571.1 hypothetical protein Acsp05_41950 [Actinokineospora sp. NBRC 105648]
MPAVVAEEGQLQHRLARARRPEGGVGRGRDRESIVDIPPTRPGAMGIRCEKISRWEAGRGAPAPVAQAATADLRGVLPATVARLNRGLVIASGSPRMGVSVVRILL